MRESKLPAQEATDHNIIEDIKQLNGTAIGMAARDGDLPMPSDGPGGESA